MIILGVAGGIGSGKSFVTQLFERNHGAVGVYADRIAHEALEREDVIQELTTRFGAGILDESGKVVRSRMAALVFGDGESQAAHRKFLESVLHPRVREEIHRRVEELRRRGAALVILDIPLLFESGWDRDCNGVVFVDASAATRMARTAARGWSSTAHGQREAHQLPLEEKKKRSQWVVSNEGDASLTERQVADLLQTVKGL
ncbi:MAG TPA: dephospho-CoA kinase [Pirellulaceae bacterium]|jgi:dephospho-CoA kinase|nr:dephospho-CoA kinase [Pirellulaceae bacterium]